MRPEASTLYALRSDIKSTPSIFIRSSPLLYLYENYKAQLLYCAQNILHCGSRRESQGRTLLRNSSLKFAASARKSS